MCNDIRFLFSASWQARCFKLPFLPIQGHVLNLINIGGLKEKKSTLNKIVTKYQNQRHQCSNLIFIQIKRDFDIFFVNIKSNKNELPAHYTVIGVCFCQTSFMLHYKVNNLFSEALPTINRIGHYCKKI